MPVGRVTGAFRPLTRRHDGREVCVHKEQVKNVGWSLVTYGPILPHKIRSVIPSFLKLGTNERTRWTREKTAGGRVIAIIMVVLRE